ncbi:MAG: MOSC domain-containing protein [Pseudomonadota bacterium]
MARHARVGRLDWIGVRRARRAPLQALQTAAVTPSGLAGDHAPEGKKSVTLIQAEHLPVIAALSGLDAINPADLRRNLVISGLNLAALRKAQIRTGEVILQIEGPCPPCSRMEEVLGPGGYNAMRGHGGWYASVMTPGRLMIGDEVATVESPPRT